MRTLNEFGVIDPKDLELRKWAANMLLTKIVSPAKCIRLCVEKDDPEYLMQMVSKHGDATDGDGNTALMMCAEINRVQCSLALVGLVDTNRVRPDGQTALMIAASHCNNEWIRAMLPHVDTALTDPGGNDALKICLISLRRPPLDRLIDASDLYSKNGLGNTATMIALYSNDFWIGTGERPVTKLASDFQNIKTLSVDIAARIEAIREQKELAAELSTEKDAASGRGKSGRI